MTPSSRTTRRLRGFGTTVFAEMSALAQDHGAVNLGQGFPDFGPPEEVLEAARNAIAQGHNQYAPGIGIPALRAAIATHQAGAYDLHYDEDAEVTVTTGATEAVFAALQALLDVGDEVVVFEPTYDSYAASIAMAGAVAKPVRLQAPDWSYDAADLEAAVTPRTRVLLLNSPHNPTGKVFSGPELEHVAALCREHDIVAVTDEVYEHLAFEAPHAPLAQLDGMQERTVTISSAGKTFSVTGWKVGWACAPADLTAAVRSAKQFVTFTSGTPFQHAIAHALTLGHAYYEPLLEGYARRRELLRTGLEEVGFAVLPSAGTYFTTVDVRPLSELDDVAFCRALPAEAGVAAVPTSGFYADPRAGRHLVRFAFCKTDAVIEEGLARLRTWRDRR